MITNSKSLKIALDDFAYTKDHLILHDIYKFIWYNYYLNMHVEPGSEEDKEIEKIYEEFRKNYPEFHKEIEILVDFEIERIKNETI